MDRKYLLGMDEVSSELNRGYDKGLKNDNIAYFCKLLKVKTLRVWLNFHELFNVAENDELQFYHDGLIRLNEYLYKMKKAGVERFSLLTWGFVYPYGYNAYDKFTCPDPVTEPDMYKRFIKLQSNVIYEISRNFTDIEYFEPTNEPEGPGCVNIHKNKNTFKDNQEFTLEQIEHIVLDLCRATSRACKKVNPNIKVVFPGFCNFDSTPSYVDDIYNLIESGNLPTFGSKSNKVEDYFDIMNWHPYNLKDAEINDYWLQTIENIRNVMFKHNDHERKIWFNEIGWSDYRKVDQPEIISKRYALLYDTLITKLPFVETVFPYRLFTIPNKCESEGDDNFGLVYNEYDFDYPFLPKPSFIELYKKVNGSDADLKPCYAWAKDPNPSLLRYKIENKNENAYKVLFLGNGLTYRKEAPWCDHNEDKGLGASSAHNDYAHKVISFLKKKHNSVQATFIDMNAYEKSFYLDSILKSAKEIANEDYDLVIISLGDLMSESAFNDFDFSIYFEKLINTFNTNNNKVITTSGFFARECVSEAMKKGSDNAKATYVDISFIKNNSLNISKEKYLNNTYSVLPNDEGHALIAEEIIKNI